MTASIRVATVSVCVLCLAGLACRRPSRSSADATAVFEWPAFNMVRGRAALAEMAQSNWAALKDMDLRLIVANRRFAPDHATEFGAFEQSWSDSRRGRMAEFGRYVAVLVRQGNGTWLMDRFFGFEDSTRRRP